MGFYIIIVRLREFLMTEIKPDYIIYFKRDQKVDYEKGNSFINTVFKKFDTNMSGDFDDTEWANYQKALQEKESRLKEVENINNGVVGHYNKKARKIAQQIESAYEEYKKIDFTAWEELQKFEEAHPAISRNGYKDKSEIPAGAMKYDISAFGMGIYDEKNERFTGECYENGYLLGLETLTEDERKQYLSLLDNATKSIHQMKKLDEKISKLEEEFDKYKALGDMANSGMIDKVGSQEYENQAYSQYVQIRNESNPFYKEIKDLEQKREALRLKGNPTKEDLELIEQYNIQIQQLQQSSSQWTIADTKGCQKIKGGQGFMLTDVSEQVTYSDSDNNALTNTHTVGAMYSNENLNIMGNFSNTQKYTVSPNYEFENSYEAMLMGNYTRDNISLSSMSNFSADENMLNYNQSLGFGYKKVKLELSENIMSMKMQMPNENGEMVDSRNTTYTTGVSVSHNVGDFTNTASASFTESGNTYTLSSNAAFNQNFGKQTSLRLSPTISTSYNDGTDNWTVAPNLNANFSYNNKNLRINVNANENYSATVANGSKPQLNHNLTTTGSITYKGLTASLKFNDSDNSYNHSNTYGAGVSYQTKKAGTFGFDYSWQRMKNKFNGAISGTNLFSFKYSMPLDWTRKKNK